jgi:hypothetical protein
MQLKMKLRGQQAGHRPVENDLASAIVTSDELISCLNVMSTTSNQLQCGVNDQTSRNNLSLSCFFINRFSSSATESMAEITASKDVWVFALSVQVSVVM